MNRASRQLTWLVAVLACLGFASVAQGQGNTYYASPNGSKTGAGTIGSPWDITKACTSTVLRAGDTVRMRGGVYPTAANFGGFPYQFVMLPSVSGVTYKAHSGEWPIIRGETVFINGNGDCVSTIGLNANNVTLDSLEIRWGAKYGITYAGRITGITIRNCVIDSCPVPGAGSDNEGQISTFHGDYYADGWIIEDCVFNHPRARGCIHMYGMDNMIIRRNRFYNVSTPYGAIFLKTGNYGNRNNQWYENTIHCANAGMAMGVHCNGEVDVLKIHHNIVYGRAGTLLQLSYPSCFLAAINFDSFYVYNNTFDATDAAGGDRTIMNAHGNYPPQEYMNNFFIFNNISYRSLDNGTVVVINKSNDDGYAQFGNNWYSNFNAFVLRSPGDHIYSWRRNSGQYDYYDLAQWRIAAPSLNATYTGDPNSFTTVDSAAMFVNRGTRDYRLNTGGSSYFLLSSGGRGGAYPSYLGAMAPGIGGPGPDTLRPVITNPHDTNVTGCSATIKWQTDEPASSFVDFGLTPSYELGTLSSGGFVYDHSVPLTNLNSLTTYYYRVRSDDPSGNEAVSAGHSLLTTAAVCNVALGIGPVVSASYPGYGTAAITDGVIDPYGNESTTWASDDAASSVDWIELSFASPTDVENITIHWAWNGTQAAWMTSQQYQIQYWNGSSYTTAVTVNNPPAGNVTSTNIPPANTQRIRVYQPAASGPISYPGVMWVTEVQVYGVAQADALPPSAVLDLR